MALSWPDKDPEEELDYPIDWSDWVVSPAAIDSAVAVIETATLADGSTESSPTLVIDSTNFAQNITNTWLTGGTLGATYVLKVTVTDDNVTPFDREGVRRVKIKIKEK